MANGPGIVCVGCGKPTSIFKPACNDCLAAVLAEHLMRELDTETIVDRAFNAHGGDAQAICAQVMDEVLGGLQDLDPERGGP